MKKRIKRKILFGCFLIVLCGTYIAFCVSEILISVAKSHYNSDMSAACYYSIGKMLEDTSFEDMFTVYKDESGNITMITSNVIKLDKFAKFLAEEALEIYNFYANGGVEVPLGAFSGISFLSGQGRPVHLKIIAVNSVKCEFFSEFREAGINQTKQSLYLKIIPECKIIAGLKRIDLSSEILIMCFENYIIGKVPQTYINISEYTAK